MSSISRKTFFVKFDSRTMETEHQLQFPMSVALTVVHMYQRVSQIYQTPGGRKTVTKANNRKHKTRTAKTLGVEPFSVGKIKENKTQAKVSLATDNRSPYRRSAVLYRCSESYTAHYHRSEKNRNILLELFLWLDFSSSSNTEIVCKYHPNRIKAKGAKSSVPKVSFSRPHATSHPSNMHPCMCKSAPQTPTGAIL